MTKTELVNQIYSLSVAGYFNGEKFTKARLNTYISKLCHNVGDSLIMNIALPDGRWYFKIVHYDQGAWDYFIPATRGTEQHIIEELVSGLFADCLLDTRKRM